jgi:hypothetical protein
MRYGSLFLILVLGFSSIAQTAKISSRQAGDHVGEIETVCGVVASTHFASATKGQPTFINFDEPYPKELFTVLIWGNDRPKFGAPEKDYRNAKMCVTGRIQIYRRIPEIVASDPNQIQIQQQ